MKHTLKLMGIIIGIIAIVAGVAVVSGAYLKDRGTKHIDSHELTFDCESLRSKAVDHLIVIENNQLNPEVTVGALCDTITVLNRDNSTRSIAFGDHDDHIHYIEKEVTQLTKNKSVTFTLDKVGQYRIHDHDDDNVAGTFVVKEK